MGSTKAILSVAFVVAILGAPLIGLAAANGNDSDSYVLTQEAREELIAFVNEAKDFVLAEGKDKALQAFNDPEGKFVRGEHYIIAYDFNGTCLAHPFEPKMIGENVLNATDSNGVALKRNMREVAKREADSHTTSGPILLTLTQRSLS
jgi:polar amino acid transport system substrate-binding protein